MKIVSVISRGALGLAMAACLCAGGTAQAHEFFRGHGPGIIIPLPVPIVRGCGFGFHRDVYRDYYGRIVERCVPNDPYRRY